jgi:hypothetical protein
MKIRGRCLRVESEKAKKHQRKAWVNQNKITVKLN